MALAELEYNGGGGSSGNLPKFGDTPDVNYENDSISTSSSPINISVTQEPRYIVFAITGKSSTYQCALVIIDVVNDKAYWQYFGSSSTAVTGDLSNWQNYVQTSASNVMYKGSYWGFSHKVVISIFY